GGATPEIGLVCPLRRVPRADVMSHAANTKPSPTYSVPLSALNAISSIKPWVGPKLAVGVRAAASQTCTPADPAVARRVPSGERQNDATVCPVASGQGDGARAARSH